MIRVVRVPDEVTLVDNIPADGFLRKPARSGPTFAFEVDVAVAADIED